MRPLFPILAALVLFVAGCDAPVTPGPALPAEDTCGAADHAALIGQPDTALETVLILRQVRVIRPGMAVTMDFRPERINFEIGASGRIVRITCG